MNAEHLGLSEAEYIGYIENEYVIIDWLNTQKNEFFLIF